MVILHQTGRKRKWNVSDTKSVVPGRARRGLILFRRGERGTAILETALVLPLLLLLLLGIIDFGVDIGLQQSVTHAASEAAREAEAAQLTPADNGSLCAAWYRVAKTQATASLNWLAANTPTITPSFSSASGCTVTSGVASGTPVSPVYLTVQVRANSILPSLPGISVVAPASVTSSATVQVQ